MKRWRLGLFVGYVASWLIATIAQSSESLKTVFELSQQAAFWLLFLIVIEYIVELWKRNND